MESPRVRVLDEEPVVERSRSIRREVREGDDRRRILRDRRSIRERQQPRRSSRWQDARHRDWDVAPHSRWNRWESWESWDRRSERSRWRDARRHEYSYYDHDLVGSGPSTDEFFPGRDPAWRPDESQWWRIDRNSSIGIGYGMTLNRVDGFSFVLSQALESPRGGLGLRFYEAYGFTSEDWSGAGEVSLTLGSSPLSIGARWADETVAWPLPRQAITSPENFVAAFFSRDDFANYLRRRGTTYFATLSGEHFGGTEVSYSVADHESLRRRIARFGVFGGDRRFDSNPEVEEGEWQILRARTFWKERGRSSIWGPDGGQALLLDAQWSGGRLGDSRLFTRLWGEYRGEIRLSRAQGFRYRFAAGGAPQGHLGDDRSRLPRQWQFFAGGVGSLRGHDFQEFRGDRLALGTLEYGLDFGSSARPVLFVDGGKAWNESDNAEEGFAGSGKLALDAGVGFLLGSDGVRVDIARNLRAKRAPAMVTVRMFHAL